MAILSMLDMISRTAERLYFIRCALRRYLGAVDGVPTYSCAAMLPSSEAKSLS